MIPGYFIILGLISQLIQESNPFVLNCQMKSLISKETCH